MVHVIATLNVKPGKMDALLEAVQPMIAETRREAGCLYYELHRAVTDENTAVFVERWESREHLQAHFGTPHMAAWRAASADLIAGRTVEIISGGSVEIL